jgi:hypothetical protein
VAVAALLVQVVQFDPTLGRAFGDLGPAIYVASTAVVLAVVIRNVRIAGLPVVAAGAASNLAAIVANRGYMPADPGALAMAGLHPVDGPSNSVIVAEPSLRPLTDVFALPAGVPLANVFSVGDVLIAVGVVVAIAAAMRVAPRGASAAVAKVKPAGDVSSAP